MIRERIDLFREEMKKREIDLYYIPTSDYHQSEYVGEYFKCRQYLSGFTGSAGSLVVTKEEAALFTDGRYHIQAEKELDGSGVILFKCGEKQIPTDEEYIQVYMRNHKTIGFDGRTVSVAFVEELQKKTGIEREHIYGDVDLAGELWDSRPEISNNSIFLLSEQQTGESTQSKIQRIRQRMKEKACQLHLVTSLDDIAWILNLRGSDVACNPVFLSYLIITLEKVYLYVSEKAVDQSVKKYINENKILLGEYDQIYQDLPEICIKEQVQKILMDKQVVNYQLYTLLPENVEVVDEMNPSTEMKAIKNQIEIENTKQAHIKDGVVVTKFIHYVKKNADKLTEYEAAEYLDKLRLENPECFDVSFETISAYGENAAMMHYSATREHCAKLKREGFLLVDSGGQYTLGTTDVTRTIALGALTDDMKKYYTLTMVGMLRLMNATFLQGCTGRNLDILSRGVLWQYGVDYRCGTGHGVGHILNVHEGPNAFRWKNREGLVDAELKPGMITTDEPGVYFENQLGIRIENELLCVEKQENQWGQFLGFECLTFVPLEFEAVDTKYMEESDICLFNQYQAQVYEKLSPYMTEEEKVWLRESTRKITKTVCETT